MKTPENTDTGGARFVARVVWLTQGQEALRAQLGPDGGLLIAGAKLLVLSEVALDPGVHFGLVIVVESGGSMTVRQSRTPVVLEIHSPGAKDLAKEPTWCKLTRRARCSRGIVCPFPPEACSSTVPQRAGQPTRPRHL